jgi:hypothetical protein
MQTRYYSLGRLHMLCGAIFSIMRNDRMTYTKLLSKDYIFSIDPPRLPRVSPDRGDARRAGGVSLITIVIVLV